MTTKRTKKGFTLIELLVVIAIIALLLSISLPSLRRAKEAGMRAVCLSNIRNLSMIVLTYTNDNDGNLPSGATQTENSWVDHRGGLSYENFENDPVLEEEHRTAIRNGVLWPWANDAIEAYRCPTSNLGYARSYSMPDSVAWDSSLSPWTGAPDTLLIKNMSHVKNTGGRMVFLDEGWATPDSWTIFFNEQKWWDIVPARHGMGTTLAFFDGHSEYWKWTDQRTRKFAEEALALQNPNIATGWWRHEPGNEDIRKLVQAVWGKTGW